MVIIMMPLKLFQVKQNNIINQIVNKKAITVTSENN